MSDTKKVLINGSFSIAPVIVKWVYVCQRWVISKKDNYGQHWREFRQHYKGISVHLLLIRLLLLKQGIHNLFTELLPINS